MSPEEKRKHSEKLTDRCRLKETKEKWKLNAVCGPGLNPAQVKTSVVCYIQYWESQSHLI